MDADVERYQLERAKRGQTSARGAAKIKTAARAERERLRRHFVKQLNDFRGNQPWRTFADVVGLPASTMNAWTLEDDKGHLKNAQPGMEDLRTLAEHFKVTTDWLLGIKGAPKHRDQWLTDAKLEDDVAAHVAREALEAVREDSPMSAGLAAQLTRRVHGATILKEVTAMVAEELRGAAAHYQNQLSLGIAIMNFHTVDADGHRDPSGVLAVAERLQAELCPPASRFLLRVSPPCLVRWVPGPSGFIPPAAFREAAGAVRSAVPAKAAQAKRARR